MNSLRLNLVTFSRYLGTNGGKTNPIIPTFHKDDERMKLAKYSFLLVKDHFENLRAFNTFESFNQKLDSVIDNLERQSRI